MSKDYNLLLKGGHVIDPANGLNRPLDVAIADGRIAAVAPDIPPEQASKTVEVSGLYVVPGLIDLHMHAFGYKGWLFPDPHALPNGATTVVDAGGAGWKTFQRFRSEIIALSKVRVLAFLNIVGSGMVDEAEQDVNEMDPASTAATIRQHANILVGVKTAHYQPSDWEAIDRAVEAGRLSGTPIMVDSWPKPTCSYRDMLLEHLRPGDIHTHVYAQQFPLLDERGRIAEYVWEARRRGILFDVGHGAGSFWFRVAVPALAQGFWPDTLSTDLHRFSILRPNAHLLAVLSKFLNMGMPLEEVIARTTTAPAAAIGRPELGTLTVGREADVAVLQLEEGRFGFVDSGLARLRGTRRLRCSLTLRAGEVVWDPEGLTTQDWETAGKYIFLVG